jgi:flagellar basal-body rod protein FlgB
MALIFDRLSGALSHSMDYRLIRNNMISSNLANLDTPGYTPVELKFEDQLQSYLVGDKPLGLATTDNKHFSLESPIEQGEVEFDAYALPDQKGNSVDMDHESAKLSENQVMYRAITTAYNKRNTFLMHAINEGR